MVNKRTMTERAVFHTDIAIIGGGIMGCSLAWHLARSGAKVSLLERATIAAGASGRTGALLRQHYSNRPEAGLAHYSLKTFASWGEIVGDDCGFTKSGLVVPIEAGPDADSNLDRLRRNISMQREIGIDTHLISPPELQELQPSAQIADVLAAAFEPSSGYVDAIAATRSMATAARLEGADIYERRRVTGIASSGGHVTGVQTDHESIVADVVVCAAGPWSNPILSTVGLTIPLTALRVQVVVLQQPLSFDEPLLSYIDTSAGMFCRAWGRGTLLVGVAGGDQHDFADPDNFDPRNDEEYPDLAIAAISRRIPAMAGATYLHGHAGLYDMTPDGHPIIGPAGPDGLYLMLGFNGAGFKKGPAVGQCLAELILSGAAKLVDLSPFALERFGKEGWQEPWSDTEYTLATDFGRRL